MTPQHYLSLSLATLLMGCTSGSDPNKPSEADGSPDTASAPPPSDSGAPPTTPEDSGVTQAREPLVTDCATTEGVANISGLIEGSPARMVSAAWFADANTGGAWIVLSPATSACGLIDDFRSNTHDLRAMSIWISDFDASHLAPIPVLPEPELVAGDGTPEAIVNGWEPLLNLSIIMEHGMMTVRSATLGETLQVTGLDTWSEFGDAVSGDFTACWCPEVANFQWPMVEDSSPPAPPPVND